MGRTYYALTKTVESFDVNFCGASMLGIIHRELNIPIFRRDWSHTRLTDEVLAQCKEDEVTFPNTFFSATKDQAKEWSEIIAAASDDVIRQIFPKVVGLWGGNQDEFVEFVRDWQKFLSECGGYDVP